MRVTFAAVSFCGQQLPHTLRGKQLESDLRRRSQTPSERDTRLGVLSRLPSMGWGH